MQQLYQTSSTRKGFTLLELLVVVIIASLLAILAFPYYMEYKRENMAQEAYLQLSAWGDVCILRAIRAYETTPKGQKTIYPKVTKNPANGTYFHYSHNSGTVEDLALTATGIAGDLKNHTLTIEVKVVKGQALKRFTGSLHKGAN